MLPQSSLEPKVFSEQPEIPEQLHYNTGTSDTTVTNASQLFLGDLRFSGPILTIAVGRSVRREALIYVSHKYPLPGNIREEYIARMRLAMADARMLGVSATYLELSLHPLVFGKQAGAKPGEALIHTKPVVPRPQVYEKQEKSLETS